MLIEDFMLDRTTIMRPAPKMGDHWYSLTPELLLKFDPFVNATPCWQRTRFVPEHTFDGRGGHTPNCLGCVSLTMYEALKAAADFIGSRFYAGRDNGIVYGQLHAAIDKAEGR